MPAVGKLTAVSVDCPGPEALADFDNATIGARRAGSLDPAGHSFCVTTAY